MTDEELIAELRKPWFTNGCERYQLDAADRIEALVKERDKYRDAFNTNCLVLRGTEDRAERLEAAASSVADDVCSYICPSVGRVGEPILHDPRCIALRAALKGDDHV